MSPPDLLEPVSLMSRIMRKRVVIAYVNLRIHTVSSKPMLTVGPELSWVVLEFNSPINTTKVGPGGNFSLRTRQ